MKSVNSNMVSKNHKLKLNRFVTYSLLLILLATVVFLVPSVAHAETIQGTLNSNQQIKNLHTGLLNIINIPIILVVLVVAFAEILHLKIDTYSFKKILPTLLLAIIAAQFSYLICKLVIDFANMSITLFTSPDLLSQASGLGATYKTTFKEGMKLEAIDFAKFSYPMFLDTILKILFMLVGSALALVLSFLFIVRMWMVYLLVIVSSIAFMALALPQTKTYFTKWWSEFLKWAFMPVPAIFFLWLGALFVENPIQVASWLPSELVNAILAGLCLYAAIIVPFKMGGVVMDKFWTYTGSKFLSENAKKYWSGRVKNTAGFAWERWKQAGLNLQREGHYGWQRWIGANWLGSGGDKLAADEAHLSRLAKGTTEGIQGRYNLDKGLKRTMDIEWIKNRNGEVDEYEAYGLQELQNLGVKDPNNKMWKQYEKWRAGSGMAAGRMGAVTSMDTALRLKGQYLWLSGGGSARDQESKEDFAKRKAANLKLLGTDQQKVDEFQQLFRLARSEEEANKAGMEKMLNDASIKPSLDQCAIHERQLVHMMMNEIDELTGELSVETKALVAYLQKEKKTIRDLTDAEKIAHQVALSAITETAGMSEDEAKETKARQKNVLKTLETSRRLSNVLASQNIIEEGEQLVIGNARFEEARQKVIANRQTLIDKMNKQIKDHGYVDSHLFDMVNINAQGQVDDLKLMERVVYTRKKGIAMTKTNSRAANDYAKRSAEETVSIFFGSDQKDGLTEELTAKMRNGEVIEDSNKESRIYANAEGVRYHLNNSTDSEKTAEALLTQAPVKDISAIAVKWVKEEQAKGNVPHARDLQAAIDAGDIKNLRTVMIAVYKNFAKDSDRRHLNNVIETQLLPGAAT